MAQSKSCLQLQNLRHRETNHLCCPRALRSSAATCFQYCLKLLFFNSEFLYLSRWIRFGDEFEFLEKKGRTLLFSVIGGSYVDDGASAEHVLPFTASSVNVVWFFPPQYFPTYTSARQSYSTQMEQP
jgi:hypothetical protein